MALTKITSNQVVFKSTETGAVARTLTDKLIEQISVKDFGAVGDGVTDDTAAIQAAINYASNSGLREVFFPFGKYVCGRLYCVYDEVNNIGFNASRNGQISLVGAGTQPQLGTVAGTILASTVTVGDAFILSNYANDVSPWASQETTCRNITFTANTTGFVVVAAGTIIPRMEEVKIYQSNVTGSGLYASTGFFGTLEKMQIKNSGAGTPTGSAIKFETTLLGGLFTLRDINISGFAYGLYKGNGAWENLSIYDSEITGSTTAINISAGTLDLLNIQGCYFEGATTNFIKVTGANALGGLKATGCWFYGNNLTGTAIDLTTPFAVSIAGCHVINQYTTFLNIAATAAGYNGGAFTVNGLTFNYSVNPASPVTYFTGILPSLLGVEYPQSVANCKLVASTARPILQRNNYAGANYLSGSHIFETQTTNFGAVSGGSVDLGGSFPIPSYTTAWNTTSPTIHYLPPISFGLTHGYAVTITNDLASTQTFPVKTAIADGGATIANIAPGGQRRFVFFNDGVTTGWK